MRALLLAALLFSLASGRARALESPAPSPRYLVHLLDYIATDYGGAVSHGQVINQTEYQEQQEFIASAVETESQLKETKRSPEVAGNLEKLKGLIERRAGWDEVKKAARQIEGAVIQISGLEVAPAQWPDRHAGKKLFDENCALCHGAQGFGDGISGKSLRPPPANLHDAKLGGSAPFQFFNAIRLGVPGTAMPAFEQLSDREIWELAFYVASLRYDPEAGAKARGDAGPLPNLSLKDVATLSDEELNRRLPDPEAERASLIGRIRLYSPPHSDAPTLALAKNKLSLALALLHQGKREEAKKEAILAYLEGVEPLEPELRTKDAAFTARLEETMAEVRVAIDGGRMDVAETKAREASEALARTEILLEERSSSAWLTFVVSAGIFLREGFEAVLILITLLGVIRSLGLPRAALYVHGGWALALAVGALCWVFSGWILAISGAGREFLEGGISLVAVIVLLYFGFWLHRRTEIGKWKTFVSEMVASALKGRRLIGLGGVAFMAVFREALEVVLFLRALSLESGGQYQWALFAGVAVAFVAVLALASLLVRFSARLPIRQLFAVCSAIMVGLSFILAGKAFHSFQEVGVVSITKLPFPLRSDLVGLYPTYETFVPQLVVLLLSGLVWWWGRAPRVVEPAQGSR